MREKLFRVRQVIVDDLANTLDVQASSCHICGYQNRRGAGTEVQHHTLTCGLAKISLNRPDRIAQCVELSCQLLDAVLGLPKHDNRSAVPLVQQRLEGTYLIALLDGVDQVFHCRQRVQAGIHFHRDGVAQVFLRSLRHPLGHGCGEKRRLPARGRLAQDRLNVVGKSPIEHLVRFIQHQESH